MNPTVETTSAPPPFERDVNTLIDLFFHQVRLPRIYRETTRV